MQAPLLGECSRSPPVPVCQLALLWEAVLGFSEFSFWRLSEAAHFMTGDLWAPWPHCTECSAVSDPDQQDCSAQPSLFPRFRPEQLSFYFSGWNNPQREMFCWCGRSETKNSRSTKKHTNALKALKKHKKTLKSTRSNTFWAVEKTSWKVYCIKWRVL